MKSKHALVLIAVAVVMCFNLYVFPVGHGVRPAPKSWRPAARRTMISPTPYVPAVSLDLGSSAEPTELRFAKENPCDTLANLVKDSTAIVRGPLSDVVPIISMYASQSTVVGVVATNHPLLLLAPLYRSMPRSLLYIDRRLTAEADFVLRSHANCKGVEDAAVFVALGSLDVDEHHVDTLIIGNYDTALSLFRTGLDFCRRWIIVHQPHADNGRWGVFTEELKEVLNEEEIAEEWSVELTFPLSRLLVLQRRGQFFPHFRVLGQHAPLVPEAHLVNPRRADAWHMWWVSQYDRDMLFFNSSFVDYINYVDAKSLQQRLLQDDETSREIVSRRKSELRRKSFRLGNLIDSLRAKEPSELSYTEQKQLTVAVKEDRLIQQQAQRYDDAAEVAAVHRREEYSLQLGRIQRRQFGGDPEGARDAGEVASSFGQYIQSSLNLDEARCSSNVERIGCPSCVDVMCPSIPDDLPSTQGMYHAICFSSLPIASLAPLLVAMIHSRKTLTVIDCHPEVIGVALHATMSRLRDSQAVGAIHSFTVVNGLSCGLGIFREKYPKAHYIIREQGDSLPPPADIVVAFYSSLRRFKSGETFRAKYAIAIVGLPQGDQPPPSFPASEWTMSFVSTEGIGFSLWLRHGSDTHDAWGS